VASFQYIYGLAAYFDGFDWLFVGFCPWFGVCFLGFLIGFTCLSLLFSTVACWFASVVYWFVSVATVCGLLACLNG
jgi:hypothetical protein